jgi:DNA-binding transcriptional ArsR family regulator
VRYWIVHQTPPIRDDTQAKVLGSGSGWEILQLLRERGIDGCTADEISHLLDLPISTVYDTLSKLQAAGFVVTRRYQKGIGRPSKEEEEEENRTNKQRKIYMEDIRWGGSFFYNDFNRFIVEEIDKIIDESDIDEQMSTLINNIISRMKKTSAGKDFLPSTEECPHCHYSREAFEFASSLIQAIANRIIAGKKISEIFQKHGYNILGETSMSRKVM